MKTITIATAGSKHMHLQGFNSLRCDVAEKLHESISEDLADEVCNATIAVSAGVMFNVNEAIKAAVEEESE